MSQMKLTITRDSRAAAIISPAKGLEARKLKSPSTGKSLKSVKGKPRPQVSSCHQTLLKFVSKANSKPKILKTLSENSVQVEVKPSYITSGSCVQTSENNSKVVSTLSENAVIMNEKYKTINDSTVTAKVDKANSDHHASLETSPAVLSSSPSITSNPSMQLLSSNILSSSTNSTSTDSETSQAATVSLPTIMSSHPVTSIQQSHFKQVPSKTSPTPKPVTVQVLSSSPRKQQGSATAPVISSSPRKQQGSATAPVISSSPRKQQGSATTPVISSSPRKQQGSATAPVISSSPGSATAPVISSSPSIVKCPSKVLTVKTSPTALAKHLHQNSDLTPVSMVGSSKENNTVPFQNIPSLKRPPAVVGVASCSPSVEASDPVSSPPNPKKSRRQSTAMLPVSRVRTIMKTNFQASKTGPQLGQECVPIVCKAAELFIASLVREADKSRGSNGSKGDIDYSHLASSVNRHSKLRFLHEILPKKVLAKDRLSNPSSQT